MIFKFYDVFSWLFDKYNEISPWHRFLLVKSPSKWFPCLAEEALNIQVVNPIEFKFHLSSVKTTPQNAHP